MYQIGDYVVYGNEGVCTVEDISEMSITRNTSKKVYYTLNPVHENGKIFAPVDTTVFMRPIITLEEIEEIVCHVPIIDETDYDAKSSRALQEHYKSLLKTHQCIDLLSIIISLDDKKDKLAESGKKLGQIEEKFLRSAKSLIEDEFSIVLNIPKNEVEEYIKENVNS